jgi:predicted phosphate transport protein (TIGR00153 family)
MSTIGKLLGKSPFGLLQRHMEQVAKCVAKMEESLAAFEQCNWDVVEPLAGQVSKLEHQADQIKEEIRNKLRRRFFMPVDRSQFLEILSIQDNMADTSEDIAVLLTFRRFTIPPEVISSFQEFRKSNMNAFRLAEAIINDLDELLETGFGGAEAEKVRTVVHDIAYAEHQADVLQRDLLKRILSDEANLPAADLHMWTELVRHLARISNLSENLADRVQMTLDLK